MRGLHRRQGKRRGRWVPTVVGIGFLVAGLWLAGRIAFFYARSAAVGGSKIRAVEHAHSAHQWPAGVLALLRVPKIGLVAPIEEGTGANVLDVAVGHLPASVMPGQQGTAVVAAHNVSWFSGLGGLHRGDLIEVDTPTDQQVYRVAWHRVVQRGSPLENSPSPTIVLEACWPLDALYLTPHRYLVGATLVSTVRIGLAPKVPHEQEFTPVGIPTPIAGQNLTLADNDLPMGSFATEGTPSSQWAGSSAPYSLASAEVNWLIALLHAAAAKSTTELEAVSSEPAKIVAPLAYGYSGFASLADITEDIVGTQAMGGTASVTVRTRSGEASITEKFVVHGSGLHLVGTEITTG